MGNQMKKSLIICILIVSVIFISGCTSDEQASSEISMSSQSNQKSDTQNPELIIKQSDVPGLTLDQNYDLYAVQKNTIYVYGNESDRVRYANTLRIGYRNVGEESQWKDQSGRQVKVELSKYDSNSGLIELISNTKDVWGTTSKEELKVAEDEHGVKFDFGDPNIGDYSIYRSVTDLNTDTQGTLLYFIYKNNYVYIVVSDEKDKSFNEAIRIAKIVKSRLD